MEQQNPIGLPSPTPEQDRHSRRVRGSVVEAIEAAGGAIRFSEFMNRVLYSPGLGYYSAGSTKLGPCGDFVTAPETGPQFAACLARACAEVLDGPDDSEIVELGGGTGSLAAGILERLDSSGRLPRRYRILEVSADLRDRQATLIRERVPELADRVEWLERMPDSVRGVILANEVLDALPCERFRFEGGSAEYLGVGVDGSDFHWVPLPGDEALATRLEMIRAATGRLPPDGFVSEWIPGLRPFVATLAGALERGVLLLIDYGLSRRELYHANRREGSLICHYRHRAHADPLILPGLQDITSWVDFTEVAEAATGAGLVLEGYTTQAHFLLGSGISPITEGERSDDPRALTESAQALRTLLLPGEMGERFKVIGFSRAWPGSLSGLTRRDLSGSL
jgi:SAM-dependent MidA family methyltransferase